jgi:hypothetical protein
MLDTALQIHYDAFDDCERVTIDYCGMRVAIGFETDEELCFHLSHFVTLHDCPEYVGTEVVLEVRRHRMADQMEFEEARCRALEEHVPCRCEDLERSPPVGVYSLVGVLLGVIAAQALWG